MPERTCGFVKKPAALKYAAAQRKKGFKARVEIDQYCVIWSRK